MLTKISGGAYRIRATARRDRRSLLRATDRRRAPDGRADETSTRPAALHGRASTSSHIAGANGHGAALPSASRHAPPATTAALQRGWSTYWTGGSTADGYTTVVEPRSRRIKRCTRIGTGDTPVIDKAILAFSQRRFRPVADARRRGRSAIRDHVAWTLQSTKALGLKVINAGGVARSRTSARLLVDTSCRITACHRRSQDAATARADLGVPIGCISCNNSACPY